MAIRSITSADLQRGLNDAQEIAFVDVRREGDFAASHIFAACNLPLSHLELSLETLVPRRATPIVLCDAEDGSAAEAASVMAGLGYGDVSILDGGIAEWRRAGRRLFSGINVPSKAFGEFVEQHAGTPHIAPEELGRLIRSGEDLIVLDARPFGEYQAMSIPGALNCPGGELVYRFSSNVPSPQTLVVVNCAGRTRSIIGAQSLIDAGVRNRVVALRDGTMGWCLAGLELEHGQSRRSQIPDAAALADTRERAQSLARRAGVCVASWDDVRASRADPVTTYLFDVRDPDEFRLSHADGAVSTPGGQLVQTLDKFAATRNARVFLCDSDGVRGAMAASWLRQMGWPNVFHVADGLAGAPLSGTSPAHTIVDAHAIAPADAAALIGQGRAQVLDLADSKDYRRRHIRDALFCERAQVPQMLAALAPDKTVLLTSPDGRLAAVVARTLPAQRVRTIAGGTDAWANAGLAIESGRGNLPDRPGDVFYRPYDGDQQTQAAMRQYLEWEVNLLDQLDGEACANFRRVNQVPNG